jgi:alpha-D-xyloside xylohydrolase
VPNDARIAPPRPQDDYRELLTRWFQFGSFTPIFRVHGSDARNGTEYWLYGPETTAACNASARLRYRLLPYIYSIAAAVSAHGATLQRGLVMDFPADVRARSLADEYMFGPALLVAPVLEPLAVTRDVYLPGKGPPFIDFWTGRAYASVATHTVDAPLPRIPLFGRGGSVLILGPEMEWCGQRPADPLEVRVYAGADAAFTLYEDDGETRSGPNATIEIGWIEAERVLTLGARRGEGFSGMLLQRTFKVVAVREGVGVGGGEVAAPDAVITYTGEAVRVELQR